MKKSLILIVSLVLFSLHAQSEGVHRNITFEELPAKAQEFVNTYFNAMSIRFIKMETEVTKTEYKVRFENGIEIEFNGHGDWDEVSSHSECLPTGFILPAIREYLESHHPKGCLYEISKGRHKFELELSDRTELIFNKNGEFLRYDD